MRMWAILNETAPTTLIGRFLLFAHEINTAFDVVTMKEFLLKAGTAIIGNGEILSDVSLLIRGERIVDVGAGLSAGASAVIMDFSDRVVMPGVIDTHIHVCFDGTSTTPADMKRFSDEYLAVRGAGFAEQILQHGVTTIGDAASRGDVSLAVRQAIENGIIRGPRMLVCGRMITITGGQDKDFRQNEADGPDNVRRATREEIARGVDFIKLLATGAISSAETESMSAQFSKEEMQAAVEEAHKVGKRVHAHAYGDVGMENAVLAGVDVLVLGHPMTERIVDMMKKYETLLMPTLVTYYESFQHHGEGLLPEYMIRKEKELFPLIEEGFKRAVKGGIKIVLGSDSGMPYTPFGKSSMEELELMVRLGGMSEMDAIVAGTLNAAKALNIDAHVGSLEPGKSADLLVLAPDRNPLRNLSILQDPNSVERVILRGRSVVER